MFGIGDCILTFSAKFESVDNFMGFELNANTDKNVCIFSSFIINEH